MHRRQSKTWLGPRSATALVATLALTLLPVAAGAEGGEGDARDDDAAPGRSAPAIFAEEPEVEQLDNGLRVVTVPWDSPDIVAYYTLVRVGSRDEVRKGHTGFAHLFEHMMFRGTERYPEQKYERTIQSFGADNNAYTSQDYTMYTVTAPVDVLEELVKVEADRFQNLSYDEQQFRTETGAVLGEYNKSMSNPSLKLWEALSELGFERHTYGHTPLGHLRDIRRMPEKYGYSKRFFRQFYTPDNTTLIVAGDIDRDRVMELVREHYGSWRGQRAESRVPREPPPQGGGRRHIEWEGSSPPRMYVGYRTPGFDAGAEAGPKREQALRETAALEVVHGLAFSEPSSLYQRLVVEEQQLLSLESWERKFRRDPHLFAVEATLKPTTSFEPIEEAIQTELDRIGRGELASDRIEAVKSNVLYSLVSGMQRPDDVADLVGSFIAVGSELAALHDFMAALRDLTADDVAHVAREYLTEDRRFIVTLAPESAGPRSGSAGERETGAGQ